jgi:exopolyphosphatase/guanosine-5'-triphosphate,3'-diphosphate pyrophosphatase
MSHTPRAVIDVGTNSVKLLVAEIQGRDVRPILEDSKQTRLGQGFYETHRLQAAPIEKTARAVTAFAAKARELKAESIRVIATSAARDATNPQDLVSAIETASGLKVEIISGEKEAEWVFNGVTTDPALATEPLLLLDVGGGSTEFILGQGEHRHFRESFPLGTVRLMEKMPHSDPPRPEELAECRIWLETFLEEQVRPKLASKMNWGGSVYSASTGLQLVGTGGSASILARMELKADDYNRERIEATRLSLERVRWHARKLWSLALADREKIIGLPPKRADVILTGAVIYEAVMEQFGFAELRVSTRGLRFAAVMAGA